MHKQSKKYLFGSIAYNKSNKNDFMLKLTDKMDNGIVF